MTRWIALAALALGGCEAADSAAVNNEAGAGLPDLALLTSLPVYFGPEFSLEPVASDLRSALEGKWQLDLLPTSAAEELAGHELALLLHPPVQTAEALVDLDQWVRGGGRVLILADPLLQWESDLPLGDPRSPPLYFMDTGLLGHWGVTLHGPEEAVEGAMPAPAHGRFELSGEACEAADVEATGLAGFIVHCRIGAGHALLIADADFANPAVAEGRGLSLLLAQIERLAAF